MADDVVELADAHAIRALAHPARLAVIEALYERGLHLTATQAAALAGTTPSAMSYHLRALERFGVVRRAPAGPDGRERPWVRAARDLTIRPPGSSTSRAVTAATGAVVGVALDVLRDRLLGALGRRDTLAGFSTAMLQVTPEEWGSLNDSIRALLEPYRDETRADVPEGALRCSLTIVVVPDDDPGHDNLTTEEEP